VFLVSKVPLYEPPSVKAAESKCGGWVFLMSEVPLYLPPSVKAAESTGVLRDGLAPRQSVEGVIQKRLSLLKTSIQKRFPLLKTTAWRGKLTFGDPFEDSGVALSQGRRVDGRSTKRHGVCRGTRS
jgi:hypothetical protein